MAISDDWTIDYTNLRIYHSSGTTVYTVNELYSWLMNVFDEAATIDDTIPMTAQTPTAYTLTNGWFLDYANPTYVSHQFLEGGSIKTVGWDANTYSNGIRILTFAAGGYVNAVPGDIGDTVSGGTTTDTGELLAYNNTTRKWWIRVDDTGDAFDVVEAVTVNAHGGTTTDASVTGENVWANPFTLGTIEAETSIYLTQSNTAITSWWSSGHIDILSLVREAGTEIDTGLITFFARQYSKLYDHYIADLTDGARTPIPLATNPDTNNTTGYVLLECSGGGATAFTDGEVIGNNAVRGSATALGIVTNIGGTTSDPDLSIYYIGDQTAFSGSDTVYGYTSTASAAVDTVSAAGPNTGTAATITVTFGGTSYDLNNTHGARPYSVTIDCQQVPIATVYERLKYLTRQGQTTDIDAGGQTIIGQAYTGVGDYYIPYDGGSVDNPFTEGETITATGGFSAVITSKHDRGSAEGFLIVRNVRGTIPTDNTQIFGASNNAYVDIDSGNDPVTTITPAKQSPFGTFAGGKFFGARGVLLIDVPNADSTNYELIDSEGDPQTPPNIVTIEVTGVAQNSQCYVFDPVPTSYLNASAATQVLGNSYRAYASHTYAADIPVTIRAREMGYLPFETTGTITNSGLSIAAVWLVDSNWKLVVTGVNISFTNSNSRITRAAGDFTVDGWVAQMSQVTVEGSASNDGTYTIWNDPTSITATYITITGASLTDEAGATGVTLTFTRRSLT